MIIFIILLIATVLAVLAVLAGGTDLHFHRKPADDKIRVACVGDSITNGCLVFPCFTRSYPARLHKMLGGKYHVENLGLNDRTLQATGHKPYKGKINLMGHDRLHPNGKDTKVIAQMVCEKLSAYIREV